MFNKIRKAFRGFFKTPTIKDYRPRLHPRKEGFPVFDPIGLSQEQKHRENVEAITMTELAVQKEAFQKNLRLTHRSVVIAFIAVMLSLIVSVTAIIVSIKAKPNVNVKVYEQKTIQKTD